MVFSCYQAGATALLSGEFHLSNSAGNLMIHLEGFGAYVAGLVFLGVGTLAAYSLFPARADGSDDAEDDGAGSLRQSTTAGAQLDSHGDGAERPRSG